MLTPEWYQHATIQSFSPIYLQSHSRVLEITIQGDHGFSGCQDITHYPDLWTLFILSRCSLHNPVCAVSLHVSGPSAQDDAQSEAYRTMVTLLAQDAGWHAGLNPKQIATGKKILNAAALSNLSHPMPLDKRRVRLDVTLFHAMQLRVLQSPLMYVELSSTGDARLLGWRPGSYFVSPHDISTWLSTASLCCVLDDGLIRLGQLSPDHSQYMLQSLLSMASTVLGKIHQILVPSNESGSTTAASPSPPPDHRNSSSDSPSAPSLTLPDSLTDCLNTANPTQAL